jgi:hypothetical protein
MTLSSLGLRDLLMFGDLPVVALKAAVDHRELRLPIALRPQLPASVVERCFVPGAPPPVAVAQRLVGRPLVARTVRWVLHDAAEHRPAVLAALLRHNVPDARQRRRLLAHPDEEVADAVLANPSWPADEQVAVARRADGATVLRWLARLDPAVPIVAGDLAAVALRGDAVTALQAMLRRPWLAELPARHLGLEVRSAAATVSADERTLYGLLGHALWLATRGRRLEAVGVVEAVACNPAAPLAVQRRAHRLARRWPCRYLAGWRPAAVVVDGPLWEADPAGQRRVLDRLDELVHIRHRTVWSAGLLARHPALADDVRARLVAYVGEHLPAVDGDAGSVDVLADRLDVPATTRARWRRRCTARRAGAGCVVGDGDPTTPVSEADEAGSRRWGGTPPWPELLLDDLQATASRRLAVRRLRTAFGTDAEAWSLAFLLLREGWELPLAELAPVVDALRTHPTDQEVVA